MASAAERRIAELAATNKELRTAITRLTATLSGRGGLRAGAPGPGRRPARDLPAPTAAPPARARRRQAADRAPSRGKRGGGGIVSDAVELAKISLPGLAARAAVAVGGGGLVSAARGGDPTAGALSGAISGLNAILPSFVSEATGVAPTVRIEGDAISRANAALNRVAELGGADAVSPRLREFIAERSVVRARNVEINQQRNTEAVKQVMFSGKSLGQVANDIGHNVGG